MAEKIIKNWQRWIDGISDFSDEGGESQYYMGRNVDVRSNPRSFTILPRTVKESGTVITDLIKFTDVYASTMDTYAYGDAGNIYKRTSSRVWSNLRSVESSHGNGMIYNPEDDYLYYTSDKVIGRYGPLLSDTPTFADDYLGAQGGVPLNTASIDFEATSSMYVTAADSASLSITGDLSIEGYFKIESLPAAAAQMVLVSKWNGSSDERSYKFDLAAVDALFGDGGDGALTVSSNTTQAPTDSACTATAASYTISATNASFATGDKILIHQTRGTGAGKWERNEIASYTAGAITTSNAMVNSYTSGAQVIVLKEYTNVTVNTGITWTAKAWNGTVGGILCFLASGTVTVTGTITATGKGFRGSAAVGDPGTAANGESAASNPGTRATGASVGVANGGSGAGGGYGGNGLAGSGGITPSLYGQAFGSADLNTALHFGGAGSGASSNPSTKASAGSNSGGIVFIIATEITVSGAINANGAAGNSATERAGGSGAGGAVFIKAQIATLGTTKLTATGGAAGSAPIPGGAGGVGRIHLDYYTSYTGTTSPTMNVNQDNNLVTSTTYQLRLSVSHTDGTSGNSETLAKTLSTNPSTATWYHWAVTWDASAAQATFYENGLSLGTATGAVTSIYDSTALLAIGASFSDAGAAEKFFDGKVDEVRIWNDIRTADEIYNYKETQIAINATGLAAYYQMNSAVTDGTANANNGTLVNTPTYDTADVPFPSPTTRQDLDQSLNTSGQTYPIPAAISEAATARQTFTPAKDPQKSIEVLVADTGDDGDWTLTVHDAQNKVVASKTIVHASMVVGDNEFIFGTIWRPLTNFTEAYHFHLTVTSTTGTPAVTTTTLNDLETVDFHTYYQFLVEDTAWHPMARFLNFTVVANERYVGKLEATLYYPHVCILPANWKSRCFGYWQEYLAIGVMRGSNIYDFDYGRVYFWDGVNPDRPNFWIDIPEGGVNAVWGTKGKLYIWAGYKGDMLVYEGGSAARKVRRTPLSIQTERMEVYPQAVGMWNGLLRYGISDGNSTVVNRCVYTYGSINDNLYAESLSCDYTISTGNYLDTVSIGAIMPINQELLVFWKDGTGYGADYVNSSNNPYPTATMEMIIEDLGVPYKEKEALSLIANFDTLVSGESVELLYKNSETDTDWNSDSESPSAGDTVYRRLISNGRYNEMAIKVNLTTTTTTAPTVKSVALVTDPLAGEEVYG